MKEPKKDIKITIDFFPLPLKFKIIFKESNHKISSNWFFPLPLKFEIMFKESNHNKILEDFGNGVDNFREINQVPIDLKLYFI